MTIVKNNKIIDIMSELNAPILTLEEVNAKLNELKEGVNNAYQVTDELSRSYGSILDKINLFTDQIKAMQGQINDLIYSSQTSTGSESNETTVANSKKK